MIDWNAVTFWFVLVYLAQTGTKLALEWINQRHLVRCGSRDPAPFGGLVDPVKPARTIAYARSNSRFRILHMLAFDGLLLTLILSGMLPALNHWLEAWFGGGLAAGLLFFWVPGLALILLDLPFSWVHTFRIEERFGFNLSDLRTWALDQGKALLVAVLIGSLLLALVLRVIDRFPESWWLWAVLIVSSVQLVLTILYPVLLAPLFNRFEPIRDSELEADIRMLMETAGVRLNGLYQMDASRRNRHTNAYFTGLGRAKRIVLFDTLLASHPHSEILSVLAHELGHYHKKHVFKQFLLSTATLTVGFYLTQVLLRWKPFYQAFQFESAVPYVGLFFTGIVWQKLSFFAAPLFLAVSRHFERQADRFAIAVTGDPEPMKQALARLAADNLSNPIPHPAYVLFHYSHPPLAERIASLTASGHSAWHKTSRDPSCSQAKLGSKS